MPRRALVLLAVLVVFLAIVFMVTLRRQPPEIPADADHLGARGLPERCLSCHGPEGTHPRPPNHPMGNQCWNCHFEVGEVR